MAFLGIAGVAAIGYFGYSKFEKPQDSNKQEPYVKLETETLINEKNPEKAAEEKPHEVSPVIEEQRPPSKEKQLNPENEEYVHVKAEEPEDTKSGEADKLEEELEAGELEGEADDYKVPDPEEAKDIELTAEEEKLAEEEEKVAEEEEKLAEEKTKDVTENMMFKIMGNAFANVIERTIESNQLDYVKEFAHRDKDDKLRWEKTHFIFIIDCSGSMKGKRWEAVKKGLEACLRKLKPMKENVVSGFTFDDQVNHVCRETPTDKALGSFKKLPFTGRGTNYKRALEYAIKLIDTAKSKNYLSCLLFLSDGTGGYSKAAVEQLKTIKDKKKNLLFYTIACETDEDKDMKRMATELSGDHYKVTDADAARVVFTRVLGL